ncbi:MAG: MBL fold metallo-hydrolase, partial [Candidatus Korarchaeota archaeon NZ13-K]
MRFLWKGSSAVYIDSGDLRVLIDPASFFSPVELLQLGGPDLILFTHEHSDHFDPDSLEAILTEFDARVICNPGVHRVLRRRFGERVLRIRDGEMLELGARVHALRAVHPGHHPVVLLLEMGGKAIFHGDGSGFSGAFQTFSPVDLAFIPVGSPSPNSSPSEAVRIVRAVV